MLASLLADLRKHGATLALESGQLHVKGDGPAPSPQLVEAIRQHRLELMLALGAPRKETVLAEVRKLRPYLTATLQKLDDEGIATLVDWHLQVARQRLGSNH